MTAAQQHTPPPPNSLSARKGKVLVVDDELNARQTLTMLLEEVGFEVKQAADGYKALGIIQAGGWRPDLLLTDLRMPLMDGLELIRQAKEHDSELPCVVMTAFASVETAVDAMKQGADDYLTKPLNFDAVELIVQRVIERATMRRELQRLRDEVVRGSDKAREIIGTSAPMRKMLELVDLVAPARSTVLIHGESGTGKELVARRLHQRSERSGPFVALHCGALPETLLESELFGHERGSFTGAAGTRKGRFEEADGGTLFLDEIGDISPALQLKLLRVLQERTIERVGGNKSIEVDVRIIAATHRDLKKLVAAGSFREDLYYRLNVIRIDTPPLRARHGDLATLVHHLITRHSRENNRDIKEIEPDAMAAIERYAWPGNVRELENVLERAIVLATRGVIELKHLPDEIHTPALATTEQLTVGGELTIPGATLDEIERVVILKTYQACGGNTADTANMLGISQRKVQYRLRSYRDEGIL